MDPQDRGLDSWDPWAEESQDPTPFADRDEDQSAAERPRRGGGDGAATGSGPGGAGTDTPAMVPDRPARAARPPRAPRKQRPAPAPAGGAVGSDRADDDAAVGPARRSSSSFGQRSGEGTLGKRSAGGGNSSFGQRPAGGGTSSSGRRGAGGPSGTQSHDDGAGALDDDLDAGPVSAEGTSSAARAARKAERAAESGSFGQRAGKGTFGQRSGSSSFASRPSGGGNSSFGQRSSSPGQSSSSFGDGSSGFGRSGPRKSKHRSWGVQLDAEVAEPVPVYPTPADKSAGFGEEQDSVSGREAGARSGNRGRAGSFDRPQRAEGEPVPEMEDPEQVARQLCLTALTGTAKTRQQLAEMLSKREVPDDAADAVLERFTEVGLIDDAAFAAAWIDSRQTGRGLSKRALAHELRSKGIDPEVAAVALEAVDPQDEWNTARALVAKKVPSMRRLDTATATRRMVGMLARKGYGGGLAAIVVREALEADGAAEDAAAVAEHAPPEVVEPAMPRRGAWSGSPLTDDDTEVGEGLTLDGIARTRPDQRPRTGLSRRREAPPLD